MKKLLIIFFLINHFSLLASEFEMNGIRADKYLNFEKNWQLVTVRYREDSEEMRFTFANSKAWNSLMSHKNSDYPDGSVFAKVSVRTIKDVAFPSSFVPSGKRRIQFMVRNKKKYTQTGGWGYALFSPNGEKFKGNIKSKTMACYACHQIVSDRSDVFSQPMALLTFNPEQRIQQEHWSKRVQFKTALTATLPSLSPHVQSKKVNLVDGPLTERIFLAPWMKFDPYLLKKQSPQKCPQLLFLKMDLNFLLSIFQKKINVLRSVIP